MREVSRVFVESKFGAEQEAERIFEQLKFPREIWGPLYQGAIALIAIRWRALHLHICEELGVELESNKIFMEAVYEELDTYIKKAYPDFADGVRRGDFLYLTRVN